MKNISFINDPESLETFSHDEIPGSVYRHMPEVVARPENGPRKFLIS